MNKDERIKQVVQLMTMNSRITTRELAKEIGTTQQNGSYILKKLYNGNMILSNSEIIDPAKFSLVNFYVSIQLRSNSKSFLNSFTSELKKYKEVTLIENVFGNSDILLRFTTHNSSEFNKILRTILDNFIKEIISHKILTQIVHYIFPRNYLSRKKNQTWRIVSGDREYSKTDELDKEIINHLNQDSRINYSQIANLNNTTSKTIISRVKNLQKKRIIQGHTISIDHQKLEISRHYIFLKFSFFDLDKENEFTTFAKAEDNVVEMFKTFGEYDAVLVVETMKPERFKLIIRHIKEEFSDIIQDYNILESENTIKWSLIPELD